MSKRLFDVVDEDADHGNGGGFMFEDFGSYDEDDDEDSQQITAVEPIMKNNTAIKLEEDIHGNAQQLSGVDIAENIASSSSAGRGKKALKSAPKAPKAVDPFNARVSRTAPSPKRTAALSP